MFGKDTLKVLEPPVVVKGLLGKISSTGNSVLAGLACCKPCGSAPTGWGSNWGCFGSNSDIWTHAPVHSLTISLYGNAAPDLSDIASALLPFENRAIIHPNNLSCNLNL